MNFTRLLERLANVLLAATEAALAVSSDWTRRMHRWPAGRRGVATEIATWPRPITTPDDRALRLQVEHADHVAFGAAVERLAANGEIEAGGFVDQGDVFVALHQIRLGEIGGFQRPGRREAACASACRPRDRAPAASPPTSALRTPLDDHVGGFQDFVAFDVARQHRGFHGLDRGAGEAQLGRRGIVVIG